MQEIISGKPILIKCLVQGYSFKWHLIVLTLQYFIAEHYIVRRIKDTLKLTREMIYVYKSCSQFIGMKFMTKTLNQTLDHIV